MDTSDNNYLSMLIFYLRMMTMKYTQLLITTVLLSTISSLSFANEELPYMPTMPNYQGQMPMPNQRGNMMNPLMMQQMVRRPQQGNNMPMHNPDYPMPGNQGMMRGNGGGMPMMQMMKEKHAAMQAHIKIVETRLENIEGLLQQLVDLQKK
jgi:hypothetical protein